MLRFLGLVLLLPLSWPALADDTCKPGAFGMRSSDGGPAADANRPQKQIALEPDKLNAKLSGTKAHPARQTWEQHFNEANVAHDGHLTIEEAQAGYPLVAKHFDDIDVNGKGYVTANDMRAWQIMRKAVQRLGRPQEDKLRPRSAVQRIYPDIRNNPDIQNNAVPGKQATATQATATQATSSTFARR